MSDNYIIGNGERLLPDAVLQAENAAVTAGKRGKKPPLFLQHNLQQIMLTSAHF